MRKFPAIVVALLFISAVSSGCYYDNEETLYPDNGCDTLDIKYSVQVNTIITNKCFSCHSNANAPISGDGQSWEGYANLEDYLSVPSTQTYFLQSIKHEVGATPMPKDEPKLSDCEIRILELWIQAGYPNN